MPLDLIVDQAGPGVDMDLYTKHLCMRNLDYTLYKAKCLWTPDHETCIYLFHNNLGITM